ncbi:hypothetical protein EC968_001129 [Mortierella alpina]|nr:hypothetical protein EC968_001129 [Mortierella alpina]
MIQRGSGPVTRNQNRSRSLNPDVVAALRRAVRARTSEGVSDPVHAAELLAALPAIGGVDQLGGSVSDALGSPVEARLLEKSGKGFSGAPVYQMFNTDEQLVAVTKIFPKGLKNNVADELSSLEFLLHHTLGQIHVALPLAVGSLRLFSDKTGEYALAGVVTYEAARGTSLAEHITNVGRARTKAERRVAFAILKAGVERTAGLLKSLHALGTSTRSSEDYLESYFKKATLRSMDVMSHQQIYTAVGVSVGNLAKRVQELVDQSRREARYLQTASPVHGDAHPGNFFYDPKSQRITVIDVITLSASLDQNGNPRGASERDLAQFHHMLRRDGARAGMRDEEVIECSHSFMRSYTKESTRFSKATVAILGVCSALSSLLRITNSHREQQFPGSLKQQLIILEEMFQLAGPGGERVLQELPSEQ